MKMKIFELFENWKNKGYSENNKNNIKSEAKEFLDKNDHEEIKKEIDHKDLILGLEIKYLDWLKGFNF